MLQSKLIALIEEAAPPEFAAEWDKSGIQVAADRTEINHLAVCLDPSPQMVEQAAKIGADMLLTHHPLTLVARFPDKLDTYHLTLALLFRANILLYSAHTSLDANPEGPAAWLPNALNLQNRAFLELTGSRQGQKALQGGLGLVGDLPAPLPQAEIIEILAQNLSAGLGADNLNRVFRQSGQTPPRVSRVAVCTGSGASLLDAARKCGAELFITGDMKYHSALDLISENNAPKAYRRGADFFAVLDVGHFCLEEEMCRRLALRLQLAAPGLTVTFLPGREPFAPCCMPTGTGGI